MLIRVLTAEGSAREEVSPFLNVNSRPGFVRIYRAALVARNDLIDQNSSAGLRVEQYYRRVGMQK